MKKLNLFAFILVAIFSFGSFALAEGPIVITGMSDDTGISATDNITKDNTLTLSGFANAEITALSISVIRACSSSDESCDSSPIVVHGIPDDNAYWNIELPELSDGHYNAMAFSDNSEFNSLPFIFTIDTVADVPSFAFSISEDTGFLEDFETRDNTLVLSGTRVPNSTVTISLSPVFTNTEEISKSGTENLSVIGTATASDLGDWTFDYTDTTLADGYYMVALSMNQNSSDEAGNEWVGTHYQVIHIDTTAPVLTIISPLSGPYSGGSPLIIEGTCTFGDSDIVIGFTNFGDTVAAGAECMEDGTFKTEVPYSEIDKSVEFPVTFTAVQGDSSGNRSESEVITLTAPVSTGGGGGGGNQDNRGVVPIQFLKPAISNIQTVVETKGEVKGVSMSCPKFTKYIKLGNANDKDEVKKWQEFLNENYGESLIVDGVYGPKTMEAVKRFQSKYQSEVIQPWNIKDATGYIYKTTRAMANKIVGCNEGEIILEALGKKLNFN